MPTFYRVVLTDPPMVADFYADKDRGKPEPRSPEVRFIWDGLSVMDTEEGARDIARRFPANGAFIAAVAVLDGGPIRFQRTLRRPGHYTLWGEPAAMLERVTMIVPV